MDFRFTEEQNMTAEVMRGLLDDLCQSADLRRLMESGEAMDANRWSRIVELGLQGALVEETRGGLGLRPIDFLQVAEACGNACLPEPLVENAGVAVPLLAGAPGVGDDVLAPVLDGSALVALSHPVNSFVANADTAELIVVGSGEGIDLVRASDATLTRQPSVDPFRRLFSIAYDAGSATRIAAGDEAAGLLDAAFDRGALFAAAQMLGSAQRCVDLGVAYARERQQFGKPIGSYQAIKHLLATVQVKIEFARPVLQAAAAVLPQADAYSRARVSHAKLACAEAADLAARTSIQVHGAMGYSWEVDVHFFLKRALALNEWWGGPALHRTRVAARVLALPLGPDLTFAREHENA